MHVNTALHKNGYLCKDLLIHVYKINGYITMPYNDDIYIVTVHGKIQQPKTKCSVLDDDLSVF